MTQDDRDGRKPYKTYRAGRGRRSALDDELAGARPPRQREPRQQPESRGQRERPPRPGDREKSQSNGYQRYGSGSSRKAPPAGRAAPRRRRRFRWWHVPLVLLLVFLIAAVVATVLAWPGYKKFDRAVEGSNKRLGAEATAQLTPDDGWIIRHPTTVLLLGVDSKAGEPARSDTIMLLHFDPSSHTINQLSVPRDTRVNVPGRGYDKINSAMFWGGPALAIKTIKSYLGIPINHVVVVNYKGFPRLVDSVGGIDMYVPKTVTTNVGSTGRYTTFRKGMRHFNGRRALLYIRIRKVDDDFHRAARQQAFVQALQKKIASPSNLLQLPRIGPWFVSGVDTDLSANQLLELVYLKWRAKGGTKRVMVGEPAYVGGVAYVLPPSDAQRQREIDKFLDR